MSRITNSILTLTLATTMFTTTASAQTKISFTPKKSADKASLANPQKAEAKAKQSVEEATKDFKSPWPIYDASDKLAYGNYVTNTGNKPATRTVQTKGTKKVRKADEKKVWTYTGFNPSAGLKEDGTTATGGMVDFNLQPFECDTISSDNGLSPYSYMAKGKFYCFLPVMDASGNFTSLTRSIYDANTLQRIEQKTFKMPGAKDRVPYMLSYDNKRDVVYAISMGKETAYGDKDSYYLNILDTATCQLKRIGYLGGYNNERSEGNFTPKGFTATEGTLRVLDSGDSLYICEIDPQTCAVKRIGHTEMPVQYTYGLQPMLYDVASGKLLIQHYDLNNGTQYYNVSPWVSYGVKDGTLKTVLLENAPTGYSCFYKRPEAEKSYSKYTLADINDLTATASEGSTTATISFTVPNKDTNGNEFTIPSYSNDGVRCYIYVDNNYINVQGLPSNIKMGDKVSCTAELTSGMHIISVQIFPNYNEVSSTCNSTIIVCGYDAPATVESPKLEINGKKANISWTAPAVGKYADFGSTFDASDITYKVVRNTDDKVIADNTTATTVSDNDISDEIRTYSYTIYATSHNQTGIGAKTNSVTTGKYLPLPYANDFSAADCLNGFTILNLNNDGSYNTWRWNSIYKIVGTGWGEGNDWIITPAFTLNKDKLYSIGYKLNGKTGYLRTTVGKGKTPESQDEMLNEFENYTTDGDETMEYYFHPSENGSYNFGLYDFSIEGHWIIDSLRVNEFATTSAPDKVRSLSVTPDANGALGATISFKLPATAINGNNLSELNKVTVYDMTGNELGSSTNITPGADCSIRVNSIHGWNRYKIVAANADGEGWPVVTTRKFIGADKPKPISDLNITWGEDRQTAVLTWNAPTEGVNGGFVDPSTFKYKIYKYSTKSYPTDIELGETGNDTAIEINIKDATEKQDQYIFSVTAVNNEGESDFTRSGIVLGKPYTLPFDEPFNEQGLKYAPWIVDRGWTIDQGVYNAKIQPQNNDKLQLVFINQGTESATGNMYTPIIDFTNASNPVFTAWIHHSEGMPKNAYAQVVASIDGSKNYIDVSEPVAIDGNNGWTEHIFNLSALKGKKAQVAIKAYLPTPSNRIFSDNWTIKEATGNDLALAAISQPYYPIVGDNAEIEVTVENKGAKVANDYSVLFYLNGEVVDEKESTKALGIGETAKFTFPLNITAAQKDYVYSAELMYDDDNADNNSYAEVEITPTQMELPAPSDLTLSGNDNLSWLAPETIDGREVTLDFENVPAFTVDDIKGWKTIDRDGNLTLTFVQYYDNYWPYAFQPLAWMTWSPKEAGCPTANVWQPYEGEKCLIHWGNYGRDADGRSTTKPDDDWFISPEVKGGTEFSFMTLANNAANSIEILTSTTDQEPESFTNKVKSVNYDAIATWQEVKVTLPTDAKYVAIHTVLDGFGTMIDNIKYTEAKAPKLLSYNIYCGAENTGSATTTSAKAEGASGSYAVSAVYDLGESELSNTVAVTTGITELNATNAKVYGGEGLISIKAANGADVAIYTIGGQKLASIKTADNETVTVPAGVYVAKVGGKTFKVNVK